jgi:hypothetical protein
MVGCLPDVCGEVVIQTADVLLAAAQLVVLIIVVGCAVRGVEWMRR